MKYYSNAHGSLWLGDCFDILPRFAKVGLKADMILCDPPYGVTGCAWDTPLDLTAMWPLVFRCSKPSAPVVMTTTQPFASVLAVSAISKLKYEWVWQKNRPSNPQLAKIQPLKVHETILVFCEGSPRYEPQGLTEIPENDRKIHNPEPNSLGHCVRKPYIQTHTGYPKSILQFPMERGLHPTQKPVPLFEYLINTYTLPGETVLDFCAGSGTTAVAAEVTGRRWVLVEKEERYCEVIAKRLEALCSSP